MRSLLLVCSVVGMTVSANGAQTIPMASPGAAKRVLIELNAIGDPAPTQTQMDWFRGAISSQFETSGWTVVPEKEVAMTTTQSPGLIGCGTSACLREFAKIVGARWASTVWLESLGTAFRVHMFGVAEEGSGNGIGLSDTCMACTEDEVLEMTSNMTSKLRSDLEGASSKSKSSAPAKRPATSSN
jgi:hypothetical protein